MEQEMNNVGTIMPFLSGSIIDLATLDLSQLTITDVALGLSREPRYYCQTRKGSYVVGQHSCFAYWLFLQDCIKKGDMQRLLKYGKAILLHDGTECITGDIPKQVKVWLGKWYDEKELELTKAFDKQFNVDTTSDDNHRVVKEYDTLALAYELLFFTFRTEDRKDLPKIVDAVDDEFSEIWTPEKAQDRFLDYYAKIIRFENKHLSVKLH